MDKEESNKKILELMNKVNFLCEKEIELFKELLFQCDLKIQDKYDLTPFMYVLIYNKDQNLDLNKKQMNYLIKNSDLKIQDNQGYTPLMYAFRYNKTENLNLSKKQIDYLIKNGDLTQQNNNGLTHLMYAFMYNKSENLNLNKEQINYFINHSDLTQQNYIGYKALMYAIIYNQEQNLNLNQEKLQKLYKVLTEKEKQVFFKEIIKRYKELRNNSDLETINMILYHFKFQPNKENINNLKNNHKDIIQIIEKRDILYDLKNNLNTKEKNNQQNKIKI